MGASRDAVELFADGRCGRGGLLLEMEPKTVSKRYHRALDRLRALLPGSVFDEFDSDDDG
ncbi:MAG: hypothetical protein AAF628_37150 [Planctomycetota bacterium]